MGASSGNTNSRSLELQEKFMTMPHERTRSLRWAGEFLEEVLRSDTCSEELKRQANVILRHYPDSAEIAHQAKFSQDAGVFAWLGPEVNKNAG